MNESIELWATSRTSFIFPLINPRLCLWCLFFLSFILLPIPPLASHLPLPWHPFRWEFSVACIPSSCSGKERKEGSVLLLKICYFKWSLMSSLINDESKRLSARETSLQSRSSLVLALTSTIFDQVIDAILDHYFHSNVWLYFERKF